MDFSTSDLYIHIYFLPHLEVFRQNKKINNFFFFFVKPFWLWMVEALDLIPLL